VPVYNVPNYVEGATSITLDCSAEGNPTPTFTWHKDSDMNTTLATGKTFTLSQNNVIVSNTGNYVCVGRKQKDASNIILYAALVLLSSQIALMIIFCNI
jgi:hypothetical protein